MARAKKLHHWGAKDKTQKREITKQQQRQRINSRAVRESEMGKKLK